MHPIAFLVTVLAAVTMVVLLSFSGESKAQEFANAETQAQVSTCTQLAQFAQRVAIARDAGDIGLENALAGVDEYVREDWKTVYKGIVLGVFKRPNVTPDQTGYRVFANCLKIIQQ